MAQGLRLQGKKETTLLGWTIRRIPNPKKIFIPLRQDAERFSIPCVSTGEVVKIGQKIAEPGNPFSLPLFSSIPGVVKSIHAEALHPFGGNCEAIEIEAEPGNLKNSETFSERPHWNEEDRESLLRLFQENGLVDLDEGLPSLHLKATAKMKTLILNACEPEPYQTSEHALMMSHPLEILKGAEILRRAAEAEQILILIQDDKLEVAETLKSKIYFLKWKNVEVEVIPSLYPHGKSAMLVRRYQQEVFNIATAYAVYEAVVMQKPFYERVVTVAGECVIEPKNIWARIGMDFESVLKAGKGLLRAPEKLIAGGPMSGKALASSEAVLTAQVSALLALPHELVRKSSSEPCIRCGDCVSVCPVNIHPAFISIAAERGLKALGLGYGAEQCVFCGNCSYVCPSQRPMMELIESVMA